MKQAKTALKRKKDDEGAPVGSVFTMLTGRGHRVSRSVTGRADCGERMEGWRYGEKSDVTCTDCLGS